MKKYQFIILFLLVFTSCKNDEDNIISPNSKEYNPKVITETYGNAKLLGFVNDKSGKPLSNVTVFFGEEKTETNAEGKYELNTLSAGSNKRIWFEKDGYASTQKLAEIREDLPNRIDASLFPIGKTETMSSDGGTIETDELYLEIDPGGFVYSDGEVVESEVTVSATAFLTSEDEFFGAFPGNFRGQRENGLETAIESFGFIDVDLRVESGEPVQLADGVTAMIKIKAPENAPATIPMWHYDEDKAKWFEEGVGKLKDGFYEARVSHFTKWNWDRPYEETSKIIGMVVDNSGNPIEGASVVQRGITYNFQNSAKTDENGEFELLTAESNETEIEAYFDFYGSTIINYTTSANMGEVNDVGVITIDVSIDNIVEPYISNDVLFITIGQTAIIRGKYFGEEKRDGYKLLLKGEEVETISWQNDLIEFLVPTGIAEEGVIQIDRDGIFSRQVNYKDGEWSCKVDGKKYNYTYNNNDLPFINGKFRINLESESLDEIPDCISNLQNLEDLNLSKNQLTNLPESFIKLQNLEDLNLSENQLTYLPENIGNLQSLRDIRLDINQLSSLPESFGDLQNIENLNLNGNQLTSFPESIVNLENLKNLTIGGNHLTNFPESFGNLRNLETFGLVGNQLTSFPEGILDLQNLKYLNLASNQLTHIPENIDNLQNLEHLDLNENQLSSLPESFGDLQNLKYLKLNGNQLTSFPESISNLQNLELIQIGDNLLTTLPESIGSLQNLKLLRINKNQFTSLPEIIGNLENLDLLDLSENQLSSLPESIKNLKENLKYLDLNGNIFSGEEKEKVEEWLPNTSISW